MIQLLLDSNLHHKILAMILKFSEATDFHGRNLCSGCAWCREHLRILQQKCIIQNIVKLLQVSHHHSRFSTKQRDNKTQIFNHRQFRTEAIV